jgi:hypothetical protein
MEWVLENWFWILVFALFIAMHLFGHGGHGAHGGHDGGDGKRDSNEREKDKAERSVVNKTPHEHQH